jgi:putative transposase
VHKGSHREPQCQRGPFWTPITPLTGSFFHAETHTRERRGLVDHADPALSVVAQCRLLKIARATLYYRAVPVSDNDLALMRRMDELYVAAPFYGSRRMVAVLRGKGLAVNRKRVRRLMRVMGLEAIYQKPNTSRAHPGHKVYPYLLRGLTVDRPNQVWQGYRI